MWGGGWFSGNKIVAPIIAGAAFAGALVIQHQPWLNVGIGGVLSALLFWFGRIWTLSKWFTVFNPTLVSTDKGIGWINFFTKFAKSPRLSGFIGMTLRGIFFAPLIAAIGYLNPHAYFYAAGSLLMGVVYGLQYYQSQKMWFAQDQLPAAECGYGGVLGLFSGLGLVG